MGEMWIFYAILGLWLGSIEYRLKKISEEVENKLDNKLEVIYVMLEDQKADIKEIKTLIEKLRSN